MNTQKKGQGHIEMIIAFSIFIAFILMILYFFTPVRQNATTGIVAEDVQNKILNNVSISYNTVSLILNNKLCKCFSLDNSFGANAVLVKDISGKPMNSAISGGKIFINAPSSNCDKYYTIYFNSSQLNKYTFTPGSCESLTLSNYSYGLLSSSNNVLYENLVDFNKSYAADYPKLKQGLDINNDFSFAVINASKQISMEQSIYRQRGVNVLSRSMPLTAVNKDVNQSGFTLNLWIW
jgi:hypothetical protein